ncbi:glycoside hydrolase/deacetylase [Basidiobolus meristosporus CBS 931.73]|uniref:Glycoside hydrolase/deacetylase n=1 Tax=Basidiobolus meristosporus CBS 931.73 TaxID=1314790 RepID=A0A1Y1ZBN6_9FUNG|nr:glycoside hydrolase/deacetylase [Basidiobolus meristosporus CBS 931.73]|eukprot:ORY07701.1 glycoside hydrolase/deacetylase [Basidiobolus meristosporus CBS 931.73]
MRFLGTASVALVSLLLASSQVTAATFSKRAPPLGVQISQCNVNNVVAVTFDDGPGSFTMELLEKLKGTRVTFFLVGQNVEKYPDVVRRMYNDGHHIASHTYSHANLNELDENGVIQEMTRTSDAINKAIGKRPRYMRCPYGECNDKVLAILRRLGYKVIYWNLDTLDWQTLSTQKTIDTYNAVSNKRNGNFISLQHDIHKPTVDAVPGILNKVRDAGYKVVTVPDCLSDNGLYV